MNNQEFHKKFNMLVKPSSHKLRRIKYDDYKINPWSVNFSNQAFYQIESHVEEVDCVEVVMPKDQLEQLRCLLDHYENEEQKIKQDRAILALMREEQRVRMAHPVVSKAYEQYRLLLNLCKGP